MIRAGMESLPKNRTLTSYYPGANRDEHGSALGDIEDIDACDITTGGPADPSTSLEDKLMSFSPTMREGMMAQQEQPTMRKRTGFLDLSRELRDVVYGHVLRSGCGTHVDFAACYCCNHGFFSSEDKLLEPLRWFAKLWKELRSQYWSLALTCRQISIEAADTFFGQPLRFTSEVGWVMLHHFLDTIGSKGWARLTDITVCHPGCSVLPDDPDEPQSRRTRPRQLFDHHLTPFGLGRQTLAPVGLRKDNKTDDASFARGTSTIWKERGFFDGSVTLLREAKNLRRLTLVLPYLDRAEDCHSFHGMGDQPIHQVEWPQGGRLQLTVANLIASRHNCDAPNENELFINQLCVQEIDGKPITFGNSDDSTTICAASSLQRLACRSLNPAAHTAAHVSEARNFFAAVRHRGWAVEEYLYDRYGNFPVKRGGRCTNESICTFLRLCHPNVYHHCLGTYDDMVEHGCQEEADRMKWSKDRTREWEEGDSEESDGEMD